MSENERRLVLRSYLIPIARVEEYIRLVWSALPVWLSFELENHITL